MKDNEKENKTNVKKVNTVKKETTKKSPVKKSGGNVKKTTTKSSSSKPKTVKKETVKKNAIPKKTTKKVEPKKENTLKKEKTTETVKEVKENIEKVASETAGVVDNIGKTIDDGLNKLYEKIALLINEENKKQFQELLNNGIIKKAKGKFYYDQSEEETPWNKKKGNKKIKIINENAFKAKSQKFDYFYVDIYEYKLDTRVVDDYIKFNEIHKIGEYLFWGVEHFLLSCRYEEIVWVYIPELWMDISKKIFVSLQEANLLQYYKQLDEKVVSKVLADFKEILDY